MTSRLRAFGELSQDERTEYIDNMNMGVSNHRLKRKVDKICGRRVRPEVSFRDRIRGFLGLDEKKEDEKIDVAPDGKLTKFTQKQPKKKPVPEPVVEPEPTIVEQESTPAKPKRKYTRRKKES